MRSYWSNSKLADWLRGTGKPSAETSRGWAEWRHVARQRHPVRYWIAEEGLDAVQNVVYFIPNKLHAIKYYINNRWVTRTHALTAHPRDIRPGTWSDVGYRILPCLFNELVDFVEVELAWWHIAWAEKEVRDKYHPPFWAWGWWRWRTWRCRQAGLDSLAWQKTCDNKDYTKEDDPNYGARTLQAINAEEIEALYLWWTEQRPARPDPYEASGWSAICDARRLKHPDEFLPEDDNEQEREESRLALQRLHDMEEAYEAEDEAMMIRLIKIRRSLWT